ncbi:hypothetical protein BUALT_Bualt09G0075400 [Buddleja alternifolia]|uniref:Ethylene-insensitive protein 2 n=1 Tax=Buddleja alternifolia TaxID=168488 RepID=A0AAV6XBJ7_9LAMI|nr:hypothetical protein BUALT_Bualt09G0075400 [Buddleja alternifolia]
MESETLINNNPPSTSERVLAAVGPVLWIAISYVDPGKWAAAVEGGARFGFDLALIVLIINCAAILCQYLSARIAIATGKNLAEICREEYDDVTCIFLGIQAEISMVALDLTMVLGTAYGLNAVFGIDLFNCVFLTGFDAVLFPLLASFLENPKAKILSICLACFILLFYVSGVLISQPESSLSVGGMLNKLSGENAYALMGVLGANIMPHNFYLHSSVVQQEQGWMNVSKGALCHDHFFATLCIFSGIFLVNCMLMNLAANVFYSSGLISLTLQDALSLLDQVFRSSTASIALILIMFFSNQLVTLTWSLGREVIAHDFFRLEIPGWVHRVTIRIIAIIPALYCVWNSGSEGIFQLLISTQVVVALLLPSSVIPLFRVASSRSIMGAYKISHLVEFLALVSFVGMLGLNIFFVMEMVFGSSDWVANLRWNIGSGVPISYLILLMAAFSSLCLMLWLAITPLRSVSSRVDAQALTWDKRAAMTLSPVERDETNEDQYQLEHSMKKKEPVLSLQESYGNRKNLSTPSPDLNLPEVVVEPESNFNLITIEENKPEIAFSKPVLGNPVASSTVSELALPEANAVIKGESLDADTLSTESKDTVERSLEIKGEPQNEKDDDWEPEESTKDVSESSQSLTSEGPGSFRSLSGRTDDVGSGAGSLSRLAGLGRAARRQLTKNLDDFWGQLFDFHGQATHEAKAKKLDVILGVDSKVDSKSSFASVKLESITKESLGYFPATGGRGSDFLRTSSFYNSSMQQHIGKSNIGSPLGVQQGAPMLSNQMQLLDAYVRHSSHNNLDSGERRYHSVHIPSSSDGHDQQPATIHGYDLASYLGRMAKEKDSDYLKSQVESLTQAPATPSIKLNSADLYSRPLGHKPQNGLLRPPGFHNVPVSRNNSLKSDRHLHDLASPELLDYTSNPPNVKKFYSMPDISGLYIPHQDSSLSSMAYGQSITRPAREQTSFNTSSWAGNVNASGFSQLSPSKVCRDAFSLQYASSSGAGSLWSRQPYEQFGVAGKPASKIQETASIMDMEAKLLQSFRSCIMNLLKLEGSEWLFKQNDGADEDLIDKVAARERFIYEAESRTADRKLSFETDPKFMPVPNCGDGCVWRGDLIISFGVWCIHRIVELSLMESRPELWGKYTYVLNRLQGIIDLAFSKPRSPVAPCFCLQLPVGYQQKPSSPISNGSFPPPSSKLGRGKFTTAAMLLDMIKDVEIAISCRKGRTGTAAGDVAFPKGKENLASVLKRYKRRLSNKPVMSQEAQHGLSKIALSPLQGL